jgi:hypothetical protein
LGATAHKSSYAGQFRFNFSPLESEPSFNIPPQARDEVQGQRRGSELAELRNPTYNPFIFHNAVANLSASGGSAYGFKIRS